MNKATALKRILNSAKDSGQKFQKEDIDVICDILCYQAGQVSPMFGSVAINRQHSKPFEISVNGSSRIQ